MFIYLFIKSYTKYMKIEKNMQSQTCTKTQNQNVTDSQYIKYNGVANVISWVALVRHNIMVTYNNVIIKHYSWLQKEIIIITQLVRQRLVGWKINEVAVAAVTWCQLNAAV